MAGAPRGRTVSRRKVALLLTIVLVAGMVTSGEWASGWPGGLGAAAAAAPPPYPPTCPQGTTDFTSCLSPGSNPGRTLAVSSQLVPFGGTFTLTMTEAGPNCFAADAAPDCEHVPDHWDGTGAAYAQLRIIGDTTNKWSAGQMPRLTVTAFTGSPPSPYGCGPTTGTTCSWTYRVDPPLTPGGATTDYGLWFAIGANDGGVTSETGVYIEPTAGLSVSSVSPTSGPAAGTNLVAVAGSGFTGATEVDLVGPDGSQSVPFAASDDADLQLRMPDKSAAVFSAGGATTYDVVVKGASGTSAVSSDDEYTFVPPEVTSIDPPRISLLGGPIKVHGTNLTGANAVTWSETSPSGSQFSVGLTVTSVSDTEVDATMPDQTSTFAARGVTDAVGDVQVVVGAGLPSQADPHADSLAIGGPIVASVAQSPAGAGPAVGGTLIEITGSGFTGVTAVHFVGQTASVHGPVEFDLSDPHPNFVSDGQVDATLPDATADMSLGGVTVLQTDVQVEVDQGAQGLVRSPIDPVHDGFQYEGPAVANLTPNRRPLTGGRVQVFGSGFTGAVRVVWTAQAPGFSARVSDEHPTLVSDTEVDAVLPDETQTFADHGLVGLTGEIHVEVANTATVASALNGTTDRFTYGGPTVASVSPRVGPLAGGEVLTISGSGLLGASDVVFQPAPPPDGPIPPGQPTLHATPSLGDDNTLTLTAPPLTGMTAGGQFIYDVLVVVGTGSGAVTSAVNRSADIFDYQTTFDVAPDPMPWPSGAVDYTGQGWDPASPVSLTFDDHLAADLQSGTAPATGGTFEGTYSPPRRACQVDLTAAQGTTHIVKTLDHGLVGGQVLYTSGSSSIAGGSDLNPGDEICVDDPVPATGYAGYAGPGSTLVAVDSLTKPGAPGLNYDIRAAGEHVDIRGFVDLHPGHRICLDTADGGSLNATSTSPTDAMQASATSSPAPCAPAGAGGGLDLSAEQANILGQQGVQDQPALLCQATLGGFSYMRRDTTIQGGLTLNNGVIFVDGNLVVDGPVEGVGAIYVTGSTTIAGPVALTTDLRDALLSVGDIVFDPGASPAPCGQSPAPDVGSLPSSAPTGPVGVTVTSPSGGAISTTAVPGGTCPPAPSGAVGCGAYDVVGSTLQISAPPATPQVPLRLVFTVPVGSLPAGDTGGDVTVFRDGIAIGPCSGPAGVASPDPCVASIDVSASTVTITVLSSHASAWDVGVPRVARIEGSDRIATAIAVSQNDFRSHGAATAVVARADAFADALAGGPLAATHGGPLLLTPSGSLDPRVAAELVRALPAGAVVTLLGGPDAVASSVLDEIVGLGFQVDRIGGSDRFATAALVADQVGPVRSVLLADGDDFADAVSAVPAAVEAGGAVLLTDGGRLPPASRSWLAAHPGLVAYAVGGPAAQADPAAVPIVGADRYATAAAVAARFFPGAAVAGIASGVDFPDALAAGARLAGLGMPLLLTEPTALPSATAIALTAGHRIGRVEIYGGPSAVTDSLEAGLLVLVTDAGRPPPSS